MSYKIVQFEKHGEALIGEFELEPEVFEELRKFDSSMPNEVFDCYPLRPEVANSVPSLNERIDFNNFDYFIEPMG